jgi:hypothetical protein
MRSSACASRGRSNATGRANWDRGVIAANSSPAIVGQSSCRVSSWAPRSPGRSMNAAELVADEGRALFLHRRSLPTGCPACRGRVWSLFGLLGHLLRGPRWPTLSTTSSGNTRWTSNSRSMPERVRSRESLASCGTTAPTWPLHARRRPVGPESDVREAGLFGITVACWHASKARQATRTERPSC